MSLEISKDAQDRVGNSLIFFSANKLRLSKKQSISRNPASGIIQPVEFSQHLTIGGPTFLRRD